MILSLFRNEFNNFNNTRTRMLDSFYHTTLRLLWNIISVVKRYNYATPGLTQDTNGKVTTSQLDITNESQEVSPFPFQFRI